MCIKSLLVGRWRVGSRAVGDNLVACDCVRLCDLVVGFEGGVCVLAFRA